jgi:DNA-binding response OmpR family regulator
MTATAKVLLYSDDRTVREQVRLALGKRVASDLPEIEVFDTATQPAVLKALAESSYDLCILDGEAVPAGGMGVAKQLKDEIPHCPLILLLVARPQDAWLASWSGAEAIVGYPLDPVRLPEVVAELLRHAGVATRA